MQMNRFDKKDEQIELLQEHIRSLEAIVYEDPADIPIRFRLSNTELLIFRMLMKRGKVSMNALYNTLYYSRDDPPTSYTIKTFMLNIRTKIRPFGIAILKGYQISPEDKEKVRALAKEEPR